MVTNAITNSEPKSDIETDAPESDPSGNATEPPLTQTGLDGDGEQDETPEPEPEPAPEPSRVVSTDWNLLLVNSATPLPDGFEVKLETVADGYQVDERIANKVRLMFTHAKEAGIDLMICSAYRSIEKQQQLFDSRVQEHMDQGRTQEEAETLTVELTARPGTSEHHTGLALDIVTPSYQTLNDGYADTPAAKWLAENAYQYGFVLRYPQNKESITKINFEPWHYRYVGEEHARAIKETGYCLEEYLYVALKQELDAASQEGTEGEEQDTENMEEAVE